jgi:hypothetical protein
MSYYGCSYCNSCSCDGSCGQAYEAQSQQYEYERQQAEAYYDDPYRIFEELSASFMDDKMTEEKFIADVTSLGVVDNFEIIKVIQNKKEMKQKELTNDKKPDIL